MRSIANIYIMLTFFVYIISCSVIFMIVKDIIYKKNDKKVEKLNNTFGKEILRQLNELKHNRSISKMDIDYVKDKLKSSIYSRVFINAISEFNKLDKGNKKITRVYVYNFEEIINKDLKKYRKKDDTLKSYIAVVLGEYGISNYEISEFLFNNLRSKSIYLRVASLKSLAKIGNISNLIKGLIYISENNKYINNNILVDIIDQFDGDDNLLNQGLFNSFNEFSENIQKSIIDNLKNNRTTSEKEKLLILLKDNITPKEVKISIIKYFEFIKYEKAEIEIINLLKSNDWEYRAICARALGTYNSENSKIELMKSIKDGNWYVRYNTAMSILKFKDENIIYELLESNDKYARDIIFYALFMNNKISYDEYIERTREVESVC